MSDTMPSPRNPDIEGIHFPSPPSVSIISAANFPNQADTQTASRQTLNDSSALPIGEPTPETMSPDEIVNVLHKLYNLYISSSINNKDADYLYKIFRRVTRRNDFLNDSQVNGEIRRYIYEIGVKLVAYFEESLQQNKLEFLKQKFIKMEGAKKRDSP